MRLSCYGFLGSGNLGNDASFEVLLDWLRRERPEVEVGAITIAPDALTARYAVPARPLRGTRSRWGDVGVTWRAVGGTDVVVVPGMGIMEETLGVRFWGLPTWLLLTAFVARLRRRSLLLLAIGAEPVRSRLTRAMFRLTARLASHTSFRDLLSARSMGGAGRPGWVVPDLVFAHPGRASSRATPSVPGRVVVGVLDYHGWADDRRSGAAEHARYVRSMADVVGLLLEAGDHVVLTGGDAVDTAAAGEVEALVLERDAGAHVEVRPAQDYAALLGLVATAEAVVGTRFHNLIAALSLGRPTAAVGYAQKSAALLTSFGLGASVQPIDAIDAAALVQALADQRARPETVATLTELADQRASAVSAFLDDALRDLPGRRLRRISPGRGRPASPDGRAARS